MARTARIKTKEEIAVLRACGRHLASTLREVVQAARPGVSTLHLDAIAERLIRACGGDPVFKGYRISEARSAFPASICVSINDEVVHGIPSGKKILQKGDIVGLDIGMRWPASAQATAGKPADRNHESLQENKFPAGQVGIRNDGKGMITDMAVTIGIGDISEEAGRLLRVTRESLDIGIAVVKPGGHVGDIGHAIQKHLEKEHLGIIRDLGGHGVGHELHEEPMIANVGMRGTGPELREGMVIAIEPMATLGTWRITLDRDEWTFRTADGSLAAHFEHTLAVTSTGAEVLTDL